MIRRIILRDANAEEWLIFSAPVDVLFANTAAEVLPVLSEIERRAADEGLFAAGFVCYEAAPGFDAALVTHPASQLPLLCFGLFKNPERTRFIEEMVDENGPSISWAMTESRDDYCKKLTAIKRQIELGNTYQINFTVRQAASDVTDPWTLFLSIAVDAPFAAYLECENHAIVSASPELFFHLDGEHLVSKPMKGTAGRGLTSSEDLALRDELYESVKNRAENVMITDMLRNDMGRVATPGTVNVPTLLEIEKYPTVWQMTSTVSAHTNASILEIFQALFPCASVTGAPKVSSMKIIAELEASAREVYTGAIGYMGPGRQAQFSVAIRTALIDVRTNSGIYGVGGGIVWDSDTDDEYKECLTKARVLDGQSHIDSFELLETLLWTPTHGYFLLEQHLSRMSGSADYFDFEFNRSEVEDALLDLAHKLSNEPQRIRLLLQRDGQFRATHAIVTSYGDGSDQQITLAAEPIDRNNPFLYHKTTRRDLYENARRNAAKGDDVLLWNEDGFITETSIANVIMSIGGELLTPPIECGVLPGTYREWLLQKGEIKVRKIHVDELLPQQEFILVNSVRGRYRARLA